MIFGKLAKFQQVSNFQKVSSLEKVSKKPKKVSTIAQNSTKVSYIFYQKFQKNWSPLIKGATSRRPPASSIVSGAAPKKVSRQIAKNIKFDVFNKTSQ